MFIFRPEKIKKTMKKTLVLTVLGIMAATVSCKQKEDAASKIKAENLEMATQRDQQATKFPVMTFEKIEHDFGTIQQGQAVETVFKFTNTGEAPLIITDVKTSCGCTVPSYPKNTPIAPGETGELTVKFNGSGASNVMKTVTVSANTEKGKEVLKIKAFIEGTGKKLPAPIIKKQ